MGRIALLVPFLLVGVACEDTINQQGVACSPKLKDCDSTQECRLNYGCINQVVSGGNAACNKYECRTLSAIGEACIEDRDCYWLKGNGKQFKCEKDRSRCRCESKVCRCQMPFQVNAAGRCVYHDGYA